MVQDATEIALGDFGHHREVVLSFHVLDAEAPVPGLPRDAVLERHDRPHGVPALDRRDVDARDPARDPREAELGLEREHVVAGALRAALVLQEPLLEQQARVPVRELDLPRLLAACRDEEPHRSSRSLAHELLDQRTVLEVERQQDLRREPVPTQVVAREKERQDRAVPGPLDVSQEMVLLAEHPALADLEDQPARVVTHAREADDVPVLSRQARHALSFADLLQLIDLPLVPGGALELEPLRRAPHALLERPPRGAGIALQEAHHLVDHRAILLLRDVPHARRLAAIDVIIETRACRTLVEEAIAAGADREEVLDERQVPPEELDLGERPEVAGAVVQHPTRDVYAREVLVQRDLDVRIGLVVPEDDVEPRIVLLDQVRLEEQRLGRRAGHDPVEVLHVAHEHARLVGERGRRLQVGTHPGPQVTRLPHVQDPPARVPEEVHPRPPGQGRCALLDVLHNPLIYRDLCGKPARRGNASTPNARAMAR